MVIKESFLSKKRLSATPSGSTIGNSADADNLATVNIDQGNAAL